MYLGQPKKKLEGLGAINIAFIKQICLDKETCLNYKGKAVSSSSLD